MLVCRVFKNSSFRTALPTAIFYWYAKVVEIIIGQALWVWRLFAAKKRQNMVSIHYSPVSPLSEGLVKRNECETPSKNILSSYKLVDCLLTLVISVFEALREIRKLLLARRL